MASADAIIEQLRKQDHARWLTTLYAPRQHRQNLQLLLALHGEFERITRIASEPLVGEIRLAWWRERLQILWHDGAVAAHPLIKALAEAGIIHHLPFTSVEQMIEAHITQIWKEGDDATATLTAEGAAALAEAMGWILSGTDSPVARQAGWIFALAQGDAAAARLMLADVPHQFDQRLMPILLQVTVARHLLAGGHLSSILLHLKLLWAALRRLP